MVNRVQVLRSSVAGNVPTPGSRLPGELWVNFPDNALGLINASNNAVKLLAVRFFSTLASYVAGDAVIQAGQIYIANTSVSPGAFTPGQWTKVLLAGDAIAGYLPLGGGTLTGPLTLAADPAANLQAATKQYVDGFLSKAGGTMTGPIVLPADPGAAMQAATKQYVDSRPSGVSLASGPGLTGGPITSVGTLSIDPVSFPGFLAGLGTGYNSPTSFNVSFGAAVDVGWNTLMRLGNGLTKTLSAWAVGTGNGSLDTGAVSTFKWYYVYLIQRSDTGAVDVLISLNSSAPSMPANYNRRRRIGSFLTNASSQIISYYQLGDDFFWSANIQDLNTASLGTSQLNVNMSMPPLPDSPAWWRGYISISHASAGLIVSVMGGLNLTNTMAVLESSVAGSAQFGQIEAMGNLANQVGFLSNLASTTITATTWGWKDIRGKL